MRILRGLAAALLLVLLGCTGPRDQSASVVTPGLESAGFRGAYLTDPYQMPDVSLTDTNGRAYNLASSPSKLVTLVFFGYTHCPDVCVGVLSDVAMALSRMAPGDRDQLQLLFVTTDPARDSGPAIRRYLDRFDPSFVGLTGDLDTITAVAGQVGVEISGRNRLPSGGYEVGHSAQVIGFDRDGRGLVVWTPGTPIADLKHDFALLVARQR